MSRTRDESKADEKAMLTMSALRIFVAPMVDGRTRSRRRVLVFASNGVAVGGPPSERSRESALVSYLERRGMGVMSA